MSSKSNKDSVPTELAELLQLAISDLPPPGLPARVTATVALLATGVELGRLLSIAPFEAASVHLSPEAEAPMTRTAENSPDRPSKSSTSAGDGEDENQENQ